MVYNSFTNNAPFGLRPIGHLTNSSWPRYSTVEYIIDTVAPVTLNRGDPVVIQPSISSTANRRHYDGKQVVITRYNPSVTLNAPGTRTAITNSSPIVGVFAGCEYIDASSNNIVQYDYFIAGTPTKSAVKAYVYDDPYIIYEVQLSTYIGSDYDDPTRFVVLPSMQRQNATWPNTGRAPSNPTVANSALIGTNIALLTGRGPSAANAVGRSGSLSTITRWNGSAAVVAGYNDNPLIENYTLDTGPRNPLGTSTYYGCPSIAAAIVNDLADADGRNEYNRTDWTTAFKVLGFSGTHDRYGQPATGVDGDYFNTPFLTVYGIINSHAYNTAVTSVTPTA